MTPQELKNSILQRAIKGKLVEQRAEEGSGEELYKIIQAERKQNKISEIIEDEILFDIPNSWNWVRFGEICNIINGFTPKRTNPEFWNGDIPWFTIEDVREQGRFINYTNQHITEKALSYKTERIVPPNTVLLCCTASVGEYAYTNIPLTTNQQFNGLVIKERYKKFISSMYIFIYAQTLEGRLISNSGKTTFNYLSVGKLKEFVIPIPPLNEQKRIVEKIEELMPLVEAYEENWKRLEELNKKFPEDMKKSLLQEAIKGKLVEQRAEEGSGEELYETIQAEKKKLIKEGKIKKQKALPEITEDEMAFKIPESWKWVRLGSVILKLTDGAHRTPTYTKKGVPFLSVKDISSGKIDYSNCKFISRKEHEILYERCNPEKGDLLLTKVGTTGIPVIVETDDEFSLFVSVALLKLNTNLITIYFLKHLINSPLVQVQAKENTRGVGNKNWVMRDIANTIIPLPPLNEQKRIVEKLEELLPLCDQLMTR